MRFAVVVDRPEHDSEHHHTDNYANPEDQHMQMVNIMADGGDALRHVQRQIGVRAHTHANDSAAPKAIPPRSAMRLVAILLLIQIVRRARTGGFPA